LDKPAASNTRIKLLNNEKLRIDFMTNLLGRFELIRAPESARRAAYVGTRSWPRGRSASAPHCALHPNLRMSAQRLITALNIFIFF
jgi:hypothetical protein